MLSIEFQICTGRESITVHKIVNPAAHYQDFNKHLFGEKGLEFLAKPSSESLLYSVCQILEKGINTLLLGDTPAGHTKEKDFAFNNYIEFLEEVLSACRKYHKCQIVFGSANESERTSRCNSNEFSERLSKAYRKRSY